MPDVDFTRLELLALLNAAKPVYNNRPFEFSYSSSIESLERKHSMDCLGKAIEKIEEYLA